MILIIGDIHGNYHKLTTLVEKARKICSGLVIYHLGDLIDRGPNSREVLDFMVGEGVQGVLGNHEVWFSRAHEKQLSAPGSDSIFGWAATMRSYGADKIEDLADKIPRAHSDYIRSLPAALALEVAGRGYVLTHGGLSDSTAQQVLNLTEGDTSKVDVLHVAVTAFPQQVIWAGAKPGNVYKDSHGRTQVFGHTPWAKSSCEGEGYFALDGGCSTCPPYILRGLLLHENGSHTLLQA